jgi:uncharacterized protein YjbI with pentapeptide repeats
MAPPTRRRPAPARTPTAWEPAYLPRHEFQDGAVRDSLDYVGLDLSDQPETEHLELLRSRFDRANLHHLHLARATIIDVSFDTCDLSNLNVADSTAHRVEITASRTTGLGLVNSSLRDLSMTGCRGPLSSFRFSRLRDVRFVDCVLSGADFQNCQLTNVSFEGCDLDGAQFSAARVTSARFSNCVLSGIGGVTDLAGAVITEADLAGLAGVLAAAIGLIVER